MMVQKTDWTQLETIEIQSESLKQSHNNNNNLHESTHNNVVGGFGFGITGNKSTGVVVKAITIGGNAHKDGRLRINDQIFQIGDINVRSMSSEQVAAVLRIAAMQGQSVQFIVSRPVQSIASEVNTNDSISDKIQNDFYKEHYGLNTNLINFNNLNSNKQCFFIPTNEIMDKNIDLKQRLALEMEKITQFIEFPEQIKEEPITTTSDSFYFIELTKTNKEINLKQFSRNDFIINKLKNEYSLQISIDLNNSFIILNEQTNKYEQFDQIIEIDSITCEHLLNWNETQLNDLLKKDVLKLKLTNNFELKQLKLIEKWKNILNYENELIVSQIDKRNTKGLGISLEGTVDIDSLGNETCCHHYIRSIMPNGTVDKSIHMKFKPDDELLQIDSSTLYAINYLDLLNILKNLTNKILIFVCARAITTTTTIKEEPISIQPIIITKPPPIQKTIKSQTTSLIRSRSLELNNLAMWSKHTHYISLVKATNGLGFSLIDYQKDPIINTFSKSIIVIRALVSNGVSQLDGRLVPGQRLVSINDFDLNADNNKNDLLKLTVDYLKSLPIGEPVRLGIQKPLPYPTLQTTPNKTTKSIANLTAVKTEPLSRKKRSKTTKTITTSHYDLVEDDTADESNDVSKTANESESSLESRKKEKGVDCCLAATSAPAMLNLSQETKSKNNFQLKKSHLFYSSSSLVKSQKECLVNKLTNSVSTPKLKMNQKEDDLLFDDNYLMKNFQINPTLALEENMDDFEGFQMNKTELISKCVPVSLLLLNYLVTTNEEDNKECLNKQLENEEQFNQAFLINTNKKLHFLKETNPIEQQLDDINDDIHQTVDYFDRKVNILNEMVKEMASFEWPLHLNKPAAAITKKLQFIDLPQQIQVDKKEETIKTTTTTNRYRSTSTSRIPCSGGFITTPDNLRRRKRYLKVRKKYSSANTSRDVSTCNFTNSQQTTKISKSSNFNVRSRSSSVRVISILGKEIIKFPLCLERELKVKKSFDPLGITLVDCSVDEGVNGCSVLKIEKNSACFRDAHLQIGDYLVGVNNEQMRNLTNASARAILNRATLTSSEYILIIYIPLNDALNYVQQFNQIHNCSFKISDKPINDQPKAIVLKKKTIKVISSSSTSLSSLSITRSCSSNLITSSSSSSSSSSKSNISISSSSISSCSNRHLSRYSLSIDITKSGVIASDHKDSALKLNKNSKQKLTKKSKSLHISEKKVNDTNESKVKNRLNYKQFQIVNSLVTEPPTQTENEINLTNNLWSPPRTVVIERVNNASLGISIVGGKFEVNSTINGIFIKHVLNESPASLNGSHKIGDRILSVNDSDLTNATHENAVQIIRNAISPVKFIIQSLISTETSTTKKEEESNKYEYSIQTIKDKYDFLLTPTIEVENQLFIFKLKRNTLNETIGLGLSGNMDTTKTSVFVCAVYKDSIAEKHGLIKVGDQILEINGHCVYGRAHSNVTPLIRSIKELEIFIIILRNSNNLKQMFLPSNGSNLLRIETNSNDKKVSFDEQELKKVTLAKESSGFGIAICEDRHHRLIVRGLNPNGVASKDGRIQIGDEIIAINNIKVNTLNYDSIMNTLHTTTEPVQFTLIKPDQLLNIESSPSPNESSTPKLVQKPIINDPKKNRIKIGEETLIEIERGKLGLGLSIVGGSDTQLPGIIIHDIYQNGAAFLDKRLAIGDQILKVNNIDLTNATHEQALNAMRQTSDYVKLLIHRGFLSSSSAFILTPDSQGKNRSNDEINKYLESGPRAEDEKLLNILSIDLNKKFTKGLGFSIIGRRSSVSTDGSGVFISHIIEGGCAHKDGRLMVGDLILEVNGQDIRKSSYNNVAFLLKTLQPGKVNLKIGRLKLSANASAQNSTNTSKQGSRRGSVNLK